MARNPFRRNFAAAAVPRGGCRGAFSLVEVVAAIALMAATLVPAVQLIRYGMERSMEDDRRQLLALYAVSRVEEQLVLVADSWAEGSSSGDYSGEGHPNIRYTTTCSDDPLDGGVVGVLMDIRSTVYDDENGDDALTTGEPKCVYRTKVAKFATYEAKST
ncbi:hypothetical protein Pla108_20250 [Botrimarina colliarenosi]|uniref:Prepilin-type N-terminal cleavage/methylation domain-containing protein n=1 Tax=Botrimarina colliarenosi TaxID=2528001 RepID=A0A5C6AFN5_9BACT|nr:hypothetical protein [Botrimarina colliarenosi]TWT97871.1 hypothetical protein Pla108_20250 [Botrimarina colliarenosi]